MLNFCTLFDSRYLSRGLAMYESLKSRCEDFKLFVFAFDELCYQALLKLDLENLVAISLEDFESNALKEVKKVRTRGEYCWTCTPHTIEYVFNRFHVDNCTYVDADIYFYSSPKTLFDEMGENDVLITPHRYFEPYKYYEALSGIYCVQYVTFKGGPNGRSILKWWADACLEWCYNRFEDGKFGDQKYLDDWPTRFKGVYVCNQAGAGMAPWNHEQYLKFNEGNDLLFKDISTGDNFSLIFYHYHNIKLYRDGLIDLGQNYRFDKSLLKALFLPYLQHLISIDRQLIDFCENHTLSGQLNDPGSRIKRTLKSLQHRVSGRNSFIRVH